MAEAAKNKQDDVTRRRPTHAHSGDNKTVRKRIEALFSYRNDSLLMLSYPITNKQYETKY
ncbi:hypothetical protein CW354_05855 [Marinicaulis flavus]|uniref:Uncharacterized protein n=1 Tax=Hyphococcus luteus TaxID=2058213 RepID=A0A2S7K5T5_9PROT|nr:hypothetical protein CW354_05855 [Marinicaulis flavus]